VVVAAGLDARRKHDRVDAEGGHAERTPDLPKAIALADVVEIRYGVAVAYDHAVAQFFTHARSLVGTRSYSADPLT